MRCLLDGFLPCVVLIKSVEVVILAPMGAEDPTIMEDNRLAFRNKLPARVAVVLHQLGLPHGSHSSLGQWV